MKEICHEINGRTSERINIYKLSVDDFTADFGHIQPYAQCKQYCYYFYSVCLRLLSSQGVSDACICMDDGSKNQFGNFHQRLIALVAESKHLEVGLKQ